MAVVGSSPVDELLSLNTTRFKHLHGITYMEARMFLTEAYDETYGLDTGRFHIGMSREEKISEGSLFQHRLREFLKNQIGEKVRISFMEYLELPRDLLHIIKKEVEEYNRTEVNSAGNLLNALQSSLGNNKT